MFKYLTEFYKQALYHFAVSAACAAMFALGMEYSQGSDGDINPAYYIPAMVLSALHFFMALVALLAYLNARSTSQINDILRRWDDSENDLTCWKSLYIMLQFPSFLWSIVGATMTGKSGVCSDAEECYYTVNYWENRSIAIVIIVIHVVNGFLTLVIIITPHKLRREQEVGLNILQKRMILPKNLNQSVKPPSFITENTNNTDDFNRDSNRKILPPINELKPLKRKISHISNGSVFPKVDSNRREVLPPLKRHHTVHDAPDRESRKLNYNEVEKKSRSSDDSHRKVKKVIRKLSVIPPKNRNATVVQQRNDNLYRESSSSSLEESSYIEQFNNKNKKVVPVRRLSEHPKLPPPSYDQVVETIDQSPYWLPPPPPDSSDHYLPENMYTANFFPETELVPAQPFKVPKAHWNIRNDK